MARVRVFDQRGVEILEFVAPAPRTWKLNGVGTCKIALSVLHPAKLYELKRFGNVVLVSGNPYLPAWGGIIDPDVEWQPFTMILTAFSGEYLFDFRAENGERKIAGTAGGIFAQLVDLANRYEDLGLRPGTIWDGGARRSEPLGPGTMLEDLQRIAQGTQNDFLVEPFYDESEKRLRWVCSWLEHAGQQTNLVLEEGVNLELSQNPLREEGPVVNSVQAFGDASTDDTRPRVAFVDDESKAQWRLRQRTITFNGVKEQATLERKAQEYLAYYAQPRLVVSPVAVDRGDGRTFLDIRRGNTVTVKYHTVGYHPSEDGGMALGVETALRVDEMTYDDAARAAIKGEGYGA